MTIQSNPFLQFFSKQRRIVSEESYFRLLVEQSICLCELLKFTRAIFSSIVWACLLHGLVLYPPSISRLTVAESTPSLSSAIGFIAAISHGNVFTIPASIRTVNAGKCYQYAQFTVRVDVRNNLVRCYIFVSNDFTFFTQFTAVNDILAYRAAISQEVAAK